MAAMHTGHDNATRRDALLTASVPVCSLLRVLCVSVGDRTLIDSARINLGMARGNMAMSKYMGIVNDNLPALLNWKTRRQQFKQT